MIGLSPDISEVLKFNLLLFGMVVPRKNRVENPRCLAWGHLETFPYSPLLIDSTLQTIHE
jgi:hypothetical protein